MPPEPLTEADRAAAARLVTPAWVLERLDTRLGTADVAAYLRGHNQSVGCVHNCEDGPYPEWARWIDVDSKGAHVRVFHGHEDRDVVREGRVPWSELANRATIAALELRRDADPLPGQQIALEI